MRFPITVLFLILFLTTPLPALSAPKNFNDLMKLSKQFRADLASETSFEKIAQKLKDLDKEITAAMDEYEKTNPDEGGNAEEQVAKLSYSLEPVVEIAGAKKPTDKECSKAKLQVDFEDRGSREEDALLTPDAQEALEWADLLCKP